MIGPIEIAVIAFPGDELGLNDDAARLAGVTDRIEGLLSDDDVTDVADRLELGSSAAIMDTDTDTN